MNHKKVISKSLAYLIPVGILLFIPVFYLILESNYVFLDIIILLLALAGYALVTFTVIVEAKRATKDPYFIKCKEIEKKEQEANTN
ncbi:MAG: hypothetical protein RR922_02405 [Clostridia bacterium]